VTGWGAGGPTRGCSQFGGWLVVLLAAGRAVAAPDSVQPAPAGTPPTRVVAFVNEWVRVDYELWGDADAASDTAGEGPVAVQIEAELPAEGPGGRHCHRLLDAPRGARPSWRPGVVPRGIRVEMGARPPRPPELGDPGSDLPREAREDGEWSCGRLVVATFRPFDYGTGLGRAPSVTTFLSDSVVEVSGGGLRRRMGVQAGDAFWFEAGTRLTVVDDYPAAVAILQLPTR
jgi:hypothetical protein